MGPSLVGFRLLGRGVLLVLLLLVLDLLHEGVMELPLAFLVMVIVVVQHVQTGLLLLRLDLVVLLAALALRKVVPLVDLLLLLQLICEGLLLIELFLRDQPQREFDPPHDRVHIQIHVPFLIEVSLLLLQELIVPDVCSQVDTLVRHLALPLLVFGTHLEDLFALEHTLLGPVALGFLVGVAVQSQLRLGNAVCQLPPVLLPRHRLGQ
mmetsp:Transcript_2125/g.2015  ORF Transcript_2125/g.2015 Transcript_2125/m.2015 type:complete len:208 (+) Transcript_2125:642-1265(+)